MSEDPRTWEQHVNTAEFLDSNGEYTPDASKSVSLPADRQKIVDTVIKMYNAKLEYNLEDYKAVYHRQSVYDDILSFSDTRKKIAAQFIALNRVFKDVTVREHEIARNDPNLIALKLRTAYTEPVLGTKEIKHLITLSLDTSGPTPLVKYHKDQWNEKDYSHTGFGAMIKKLNGEGLPKVMNLPDDL